MGRLLGVVLGMLLIIFAAPFAQQLWRVAVPASHWLEVRGIECQDAYIGEPILCRVDREVHVSTGAEVVLTLRHADDYYEGYCARRRWVDYRVSMPPAEWRTVDELMDIGETNPPCRVQPGLGAHVLMGKWTIIAPDGTPKTIAVESNEFTVKER